MGMMRDAFRISVRKPEEKSALESLCTDGKIILKWILMK
jgi:hypothetical protein